MELGRSQGQVTSSSEIGLGSPLGGPSPGQGQSSNKDVSQGSHSVSVFSVSRP